MAYSLLTLPVDILSPITNLLDGTDVYNLTKASKTVQELLEHRPIATKVSIKSKRLRGLPRFCLAFMGLRELSICFDATQYLGLTHENLCKMPKTLERLELLCYEAFHVFFTNYRRPPNYLALRILEDDTFRWTRDYTPNVMDIGAHFPRLQRLHLDGQQAAASFAVLRALPSYLTEVDLSSDARFDPAWGVVQLPAFDSLTSLFLYTEFILENPGCLPPTMTNLNLPFVCIRSPLPPLPHLELLTIVVSENFQWPNPPTETWPLPNLTTCNVKLHCVSHLNYFLDAIYALPKMTWLSVMQPGFENSHFAKVPRTLTILDCYITDNVTVELLKYLPRSLTEWSAYLSESFGESPWTLDDPDVVALLPPKLANVYGFFRPVPPENIKNLPRQLINYSGMDRGSSETPDDLKNFPPNYHRVNLSDPNCILNLDYVNLLPKLTQLQYEGGATWTATMTAALPKTLETLKMAFVRSMDAVAIKTLPSSIRHLELSNLAIDDEGLSHLPRALEDFVATGLTNHSSACVARLPRVLLSLHLKMVESWTDDDMAQLPPQLKVLKAPRLRNLTDRGILLLPDSLRTIAIRLNRNFTPACLRSLPSNCNSLLIRNNYNFKSKHRRLFPRNVRIRARGFKYNGDDQQIVSK